MTRALKLLLSLAVAAAPATAQVESQVTRFEVAGVPVILKPVTANEVVAVRLYIRGGAAALTPANAGIEAMMLAAADHGTRKYDKNAFTALATQTGTQIGSSTSMDYSVLSMQGVRQNWEKAWDLFAQAALEPTFPAAEVELVRGQMVDAAKRRSDDPDTYLNFLADSVFYSAHPYAVIPAGTERSLTAITRDALAAWHKQRMTKENLLLVVVGNVSRSDLTSKIQQAFGNLPATGGRAAPVRSVSAITPDLLVVQRPLPTNYITGFFVAPSLSDPDYVAFRAATDMLGDRLFEEVRTRRNMTYAVAAGLETRVANRGRVYVTAVAPDTTMKVIFSTVRELQSGTLDPALVAENANVSLTTYLMGQQTNMGQAATLGLWEISGGGWQNYYRLLEQYPKVTAADIQRVAKKYMQRARFVMIGDPAKITRSVVVAF